MLVNFDPSNTPAPVMPEDMPKSSKTPISATTQKVAFEVLELLKNIS